MCKADGCMAEIFANGFCHTHYDVDRLARAPVCSVDECGNKSHAKGLCNKHYRVQLQENKPECEVKGCTGKIVAHGLCDKHRIRLSRHGHLQTTRPDDWGLKEKHSMYGSWSYMRQMSATVPMDERWSDFWKFVEDVGERPSERHVLRRKNEYSGYGKDNFKWVITEENKDRAEYAREWRKNNPDKSKNSWLRKKYGITLIEYNQMLESQNGVCKICEKSGLNSSGNLHVDHCHTTNKVRGLLCARCNIALGNLNDDPELFRKAIKYLEQN